MGEKLNKCNEEVLFYNQSIADAQNEIKLKSDALKEIEKRNTTKKSVYVRQEGNKEEVHYNFGKRKSRLASKDALFKKKLRITNEGKEKQHEIDNLSKKKIRETPEGRKKHQESMRKIRETPEGKEKQKEKLSKKKIREIL